MDLVRRQEEDVIRESESPIGDQAAAHLEDDSAEATVKEGLLEPGTLPQADAGLRPSEDAGDDRALQHSRNERQHAPDGKLAPDASRISDALLGLTSKDLERGLAGGQQVVSNQPHERRRILLEARDRQHQLAGAPETPLLPKSRHRDV